MHTNIKIQRMSWLQMQKGEVTTNIIPLKSDALFCPEEDVHLELNGEVQILLAHVHTILDFSSLVSISTAQTLVAA